MSDTIEFRVRVVRAADAEPVPRARVHFDGRRFRCSATTGVDGTAMLSMPPGLYRVRVTADGHAPAHRIWRIRTDRARTVRLPRGRRVVGRVVDGDGPVRGGRVRIYHRSNENGHDAVTDGDGRFAIDAVGRGAAKVVCTVDGRVRFVGDLIVIAYVPWPLRRTIRLRAPAALEGVLTRDGCPLENFTVRASTDRLEMVPVAWPATRTDALGRYRLECLPPGRVNLVAGEHRRRLRLAPGQRRTADIAF